ncbi:hypothetical protein K402DRAFT_396189 [Aulographum hederae CBS 113979]|uniref:Uncharacterized protein n=1 Tax=Aulographum hederae CBS 113979 TaxID=1176131 RepID=A0A6G1GT85_9PEZI|nr:hypothetical protein K402DRAFT_396189 [Aulographum hederae CBS 113979]
MTLAVYGDLYNYLMIKLQTVIANKSRKAHWSSHSKPQIVSNIPSSSFRRKKRPSIPSPPRNIPIHIMAPQHNPPLGLSLARSGFGLVLGGILSGPLILLAPHPQLALTSHIQFGAQGSLTILIGLLVHTKWFNARSGLRDGKNEDSDDFAIQDCFSPTQEKVVFWGIASTWLVLLSEVANAWWATGQALPLALAREGISRSSAKVWQEGVVNICHGVNAVGLYAAFGIIAWKLCSPQRPKADKGISRADEAVTETKR